MISLRDVAANRRLRLKHLPGVGGPIENVDQRQVADGGILGLQKPFRWIGLELVFPVSHVQPLDYNTLTACENRVPRGQELCLRGLSEAVSLA